MNRISRRHFIYKSVVGTGSLLLFPHFSSPAFRDTGEYIVTDTEYGKLRGIRESGVNIFRGIPYAGYVSGNRRFRWPASLKPWAGILNALQLGPPAIQPPNQTYGINEPEPAEDCLVLNIWTPGNDTMKRPVMFYNHGGGFNTGSGGSAAQDGANLARFFDVVVVQSNHRLGLMGYLYLDEIAGEEYKGSGNMGMLDIITALEWVHNNIEHFGGDPDNVMIFGESGGGAKTSCLYAMPDASPYFSKASIESGPGIMMNERDMANRTTRMVLKELNISPRKWRKLLEVPLNDLLTIQIRLPETALKETAGNPEKMSKGIGAAGLGRFGPVVDGVILPGHPFYPAAPEISRDKTLITGWNEDEYTFFGMVSGEKEAFNLDFQGLKSKLAVQYGERTDEIVKAYREARPEASASDIFVAISSFTRMGMGSIEIAEKKYAQKGAPVFLYNFGYKSEVKIPGTDYSLGTPHIMDIQFKFYNLVDEKGNSRTPGNSMGGARPERILASKNFAELWSSFAKTGVPEAEGQPHWPEYNTIDRPVMRIDSECEVIYDRFRLERKYFM
ncbi:MAG: carboxylesterase/lipase family protein [Bacteroidales bacterium]|nr:carboxylesterase/lipase family protein [Bacteroidales bacterium]